MSQDTDGLDFLPLGGSGEIGMNFNLYRCGGKWLAVDCGIGFANGDKPEVDVMMADPGFIAGRRNDLLGLVITHAHEDHLGAVAWLWPRLACPVYATPFAAAVIRRKLSEAQLLSDVKLHVVPPGGAIELPPFSLRFIGITHSVPEAQALAITTPFGTVLHTGDFKLDPHPLVGPPTDETEFAALGDAGVIAMICDSTNAMIEGRSGSEAEVRRALAPLIAGLDGLVAVTCFASNLARVESVALAAREAGRSVALVGRSLRNLDAAARSCGYLSQTPPFLSEHDIGSVPRENLLLLVTGSQGEPSSALARIAGDTHPHVALGRGDTVIFSSRMIPGNERPIGTVQDNLVRRGVQVMTADDHHVHVSGHAARDELRRLYQLVRPGISVPVHGEWRHLTAHASLAEQMGATPVLIEDGDILRLAPGRAQVIDSAPTGRLVVDGTRLVPMSSDILSARRKMLSNGVVVASVAVDSEGGLLGAPRLSAPGLLEDDDPATAGISADFAASLEDLPASLRSNDAVFAEAARSALRRVVRRRLQKRPLVDVHVVRVPTA